MFRKVSCLVFFALMAFLFSGIASAEEVAAAAGAHNVFTMKAAIALAVGFGLALAVVGGALGQSRAAAAALEGIARNPGGANKVQTPMIIGLALIESLVIYAFVISIMLQGKM